MAQRRRRAATPAAKPGASPPVENTGAPRGSVQQIVVGLAALALALLSFVPPRLQVRILDDSGKIRTVEPG